MNKNKKSTSELLMDELEPIINHPRRKSFVKRDTTEYSWEDEGGAIHPEYVHPTEHDESDDLEDAKVIEEEYRESDMDYSGAFESDIKE